MATNNTTPPKYSRDELARLAAVLSGIAAGADEDPAVILEDDDPEDLRSAADFLTDTVAVLDQQKANARKRAVDEIIRRKQHPRRRQSR